MATCSSQVTNDAKIRGKIALLVTMFFSGIPAVTVLLYVFGVIALSDLGNILRELVLYLGPLMGPVFGYYFRSP